MGLAVHVWLGAEKTTMWCGVLAVFVVSGTTATSLAKPDFVTFFCTREVCKFPLPSIYT